MISKFAENDNFGSEIFAEMNRVLEEDMVVGEIKKEASLEVAPAVNSFSDLVNEVKKCADALEDVGHPAFKKAMDVLAYVDSSMKG